MGQAKGKAEYSPLQKAEAAFKIINKEKSWTDVCEEYGCSKSSLSAWVADAKKLLRPPELRTEPNRTSSDDQEELPNSHFQVLEGGKAERPKHSQAVQTRTIIPSQPNRTEPTEPAEPETVAGLRAQFETNFLGLMLDSVKMLRSWAQTLSDPDVIARNPSGVNELGQTVLNRADGIAHMVLEDGRSGGSGPSGSTGS